jgi:hypothetical protein
MAMLRAVMAGQISPQYTIGAVLIIYNVVA